MEEWCPKFGYKGGIVNNFNEKLVQLLTTCFHEIRNHVQRNLLNLQNQKADKINWSNFKKLSKRMRKVAWLQKWQEVQGTPHWNVSLKFSLTDKNMQVKFEGGFTTSFCEILTVHPLLDQMWITLSFIWFLLNFFLFLCDFSFGSEPVWVILTTGHITAISSFIFSVILKVSYSLLQTNQIRPFNFWENLRLANLLFKINWPLQGFAAPMRSELLTYFQKPCKNL